MKVNFSLSPRQKAALDAIRDPGVKELLYGGAKGGGKSVFACIWNWLECVEDINRFSLKPTKNPPPVAWMGRKQSVDFNKTTLESWKEFIPADTYVIREQKKEIVILDTVKIDYGGLDRTETINKFNSAEYGRITVDQAEEVNRDEISLLRGSQRRTLRGRPMQYKALFTANPRQCWLKPEFIVSPEEGRKFVQALPSDNPFLRAGYIEQLQDAFSHRPELLAAYLHGKWDAIEAPDQIFRDQWFDVALTRTMHHQHQHRLTACDPARFGDDETCIYDFDETGIVDTDIYGQRDTYYTATRIHQHAIKNKSQIVVVDVIGVGAGVVDSLRTMNAGQYTIIAFNASEKASNTAKWYNKRAEAWDTVSKRMAAGEIDLREIDQKLRDQLLAPTYKFRGSRVMVEPKDELKKRLGSSPDRADCYVMGQFYLPKAKIDEPARDMRSRMRIRRYGRVSPMAM